MSSWTSATRVHAALSHGEPDRVPVLLALSLHGAKELGLPLSTYMRHPELAAEAQVRLRRRYGHDALSGFLYAAVEHEAFGGEVIFSDEGPPGAGAPVLRSRQDVYALQVPDVERHPRLVAVAEAIHAMAARAAGEVPVLGACVAPASLPIMLLGFERYLVLLHEDPDAVERLLAVTSAFCARWAKMQRAAGASAIAYFDPMSSVTITDEALFTRVVEPLALRLVPALGAPVVLHLASGRVGPRLERLAASGAVAIGVSALDDLAALKARARGRVALLGNLNGVAMASWTEMQAREEVRAAVAAGAPGGGLLLADNHGEIPFQVPEPVLHAIMDEVHQAGRYPITVGDNA